MRTHHGDILCQISQCDKVFLHNASLKIHIRINPRGRGLFNVVSVVRHSYKTAILQPYDDAYRRSRDVSWGGGNPPPPPPPSMFVPELVIFG